MPTARRSQASSQSPKSAVISNIALASTRKQHGTLPDFLAIHSPCVFVCVALLPQFQAQNSVQRPATSLWSQLAASARCDNLYLRALPSLNCPQPAADRLISRKDRIETSNVTLRRHSNSEVAIATWMRIALIKTVRFLLGMHEPALPTHHLQSTSRQHMPTLDVLQLLRLCADQANKPPSSAQIVTISTLLLANFCDGPIPHTVRASSPATFVPILS